MDEAGLKGYDADAWFGIFAPAGTPNGAIERINAEVNRAIGVASVRQRFETLGCEPAGGTAVAFRTYVRDEVARWGKVIRDAGVQIQ
jgi:tripartite-type tricarboxylate transporter receptor subunit TctC